MRSKQSPFALLVTLVAFVGAGACGGDDTKKTPAAQGGAGGTNAAGGKGGAGPADAGSAGAASGEGGMGESDSGGSAGTSGGSAGTGGSGGAGTSATTGCSFGDANCEEYVGPLLSAAEFEQECMFEERTVLDSCPIDDVSGVCTTPDPPGERRFFYYGLDAQGIADAEQECSDAAGSWSPAP